MPRHYKGKINTGKVKRARKKMNIKNLYRAGGYVRKLVRNSIKAQRKTKKKSKITGEQITKKEQKASPPGTPPFTHGEKKPLKNSIAFDVSRGQTSVIIGPRFDIVGDSAKAHEFGGEFRNKKYPKRPFMGPALKRALPKIPKFWANSLQA